MAPFTADRLAVASATGITLYDTHSLAVAAHFPAETPVLALAVVPGAGDGDATVLALTAAGRVLRWSPRAETAPAGSGATLAQMAPGGLAAASFAPGGGLVATLGGSERSGNEIRIYDVGSGELRRILDAHGGRAEQLLFLPAGPGLPTAPYLLTRGNDGRVRLWHSARWQELPLPAALTWGVTTLAATWDGERNSPLLAAGHTGGSVSLWDARTWQRLPLAAGAGEGPLHALALSGAAGRLAGAYGDGTLALWDTAGGERLRSCPGAARPLAFLGAEARLLTLDAGGRLQAWEGVTRACPAEPLAASAADRPFLARLDFLAQGSGDLLAAAGQTGRVFLWDLGEERVIRVLDPGGPVGALALSPDGQVAAGGVTGARLWAADGVFWHDLGGHVVTRPDAPNVLALAFSPAPAGETAGVLASADRTGLLKLWRAEDGAMLRIVLPPEEAPVTSLSFSPDGYNLLVGSGTGVTIWQPRRGELLREVAPPGTAVAAPLAGGTLQGNWELVAVLRGSRIELYDEEGAHLRTLQAVPAGERAEAAAVTAATFLRPPAEPDRLLLATGHDDGQVRLWDPYQGTLLGIPAAHPEVVTALAGEGCRLVSAGSAGTLRVDGVCGD